MTDLWKNEFESRNLLTQYRIPTGKYQLALSEDQAVTIANSFGYPVVLKVVSADIIHKTESGGIKLKLKNSAELRRAYQQIMKDCQCLYPDSNIEGVLVTPQAPEGIEVIIGGIKDKQFGAVIMFGLGGIFTEVYNDVNFRLAPLEESEALALIKSIKAFPLLDGFRGQTVCDLKALTRVLISIGNLIAQEPEIKEIDLNPVRCYADGVLALDALIKTSP